MKKIIFLLLCCLNFTLFAHSQKTVKKGTKKSRTVRTAVAPPAVSFQKKLKTDNIYSIPVGNELGLVREYTNDEILTFIEASEWQSYYKENISLVPKVIVRLSRQALAQHQIEAKNVWYRGLQNNTTEELRKVIVEKYGNIDATNFKKYGILLLVLEKIDRAVMYNQ